MILSSHYVNYNNHITTTTNPILSFRAIDILFKLYIVENKNMFKANKKKGNRYLGVSF